MPTLKELRALQALTVADLAAAAGVGQSTILAIESGRELPMQRTARKLAKALDVPLLDIAEVARASAERWSQRRGGKKNAPAD